MFFALRVFPILILSVALFSAGTFRSGATSDLSRLRNNGRFTNYKVQHSVLDQIESGRIAFAESGQIYLINADGSGLTQLTNSDPSVYNYQPALSPDGTRVAFASSQSGRSQILIVNSDGTDLRTLTTNSISIDSEPAWSPDGQRLAFVRGYDPTSGGVANSTSCAFEIYLLDADGNSPLIRLTDGSGASDPSWSPDGTRIAYASNRGGNFDIYSIELDSGKVDQLTQTPEDEAEPTWSPNGQEIAYARGYVHATFDCGFAHTGLSDPIYEPGSDIYRMLSDGSKQVRVTTTENNFEPTWSPDGTSLAFVSFRDNQTQLFILDQYHKEEYSITTTAGDKSSPSWR
jgi:Periplasmic component of the Tol biopolymer transport system